MHKNTTLQESTYSTDGDKNLQELDRATRFTEWLYEQVKPHLSGNILEIGSGIGTYSTKIDRDFPNNNITLSELDPEYKTLLSKKIIGSNRTVVSLNIETYTDTPSKETFDSIFSLNVFEHIKDDKRALKNVYTLLKSGGVFVILVPAHPWLYNQLDISVEHYRRYTKNELSQKAVAAGFTIKKIYYFNAIAILGWLWNGTIKKQGVLKTSLVRFFDVCVPLFRFIERVIFRKKFGISLIAILEKPDHETTKTTFSKDL